MLQRRSLRISIYVIFAIGLALLLLVLQFPYQAMEKRLEAALSRTALEQVDIQELGYAFPWAVAFDGISLRLAAARGAPRVEIGPGRIAPDPGAVLSGRLGARFSARLFSGMLSGRCETGSWLRTELQALQCTWSDLKLQQAPLPAQGSRLGDIAGSCSGSLSLRSAAGNRFPAGSGELRLKGGSFALHGLPVRDLRIADIEGEARWRLEQGSLRLQETRFRAKGIKGSASGALELKRPWLSSRSRLRGRVSFSPSHPRLYSLVRDVWKTTELDFELRGPLRQLRISRR